MNILFVEDEKELRASGVAQLESKGHTVYPTNDLAEARAVLAYKNIRIDLIISDHLLPDGFGIQFVVETQKTHPEINCVIVSGCLTPESIATLVKYNIRYFQKPLLYARVIDEVRRGPMDSAPIFKAPESAPETLEMTKGSKSGGRRKKKRFRLW